MGCGLLLFFCCCFAVVFFKLEGFLINIDLKNVKKGEEKKRKKTNMKLVKLT